jgi:hypothetical protein
MKDMPFEKTLDKTFDKLRSSSSQDFRLAQVKLRAISTRSESGPEALSEKRARLVPLLSRNGSPGQTPFGKLTVNSP